MMRTLQFSSLTALLLGALTTGCMTFETTLPGTLDLRAAMAQPQDAPLEPKRPAFGDLGDSFFEGFVLANSTDKPTKGEYAIPREPLAGQFVTPPVPAGGTVYRRVLRQWFIIGLFPILADPANITADLQRELTAPGAKASHLRIASGADLIDFGRAVVANVFSWTGVLGLLGLVPTRTTEVVAYLSKPAAAMSPQPEPPPVPQQPIPPPVGPTPSAPDAPVAQ